MKKEMARSNKMTKDEKREILESVLDGDLWEYREVGTRSDVDDIGYKVGDNNSWKDYQLGDPINEDFEYRKKSWINTFLSKGSVEDDKTKLLVYNVIKEYSLDILEYVLHKEKEPGIIKYHELEDYVMHSFGIDYY